MDFNSNITVLYIMDKKSEIFTVFLSKLIEKAVLKKIQFDIVDYLYNS